MLLPWIILELHYLYTKDELGAYSVTAKYLQIYLNFIWKHVQDQYKHKNLSIYLYKRADLLLPA